MKELRAATLAEVKGRFSNGFVSHGSVVGPEGIGSPVVPRQLHAVSVGAQLLSVRLLCFWFSQHPAVKESYRLCAKEFQFWLFFFYIYISATT